MAGRGSSRIARIAGRPVEASAACFWILTVSDFGGSLLTIAAQTQISSVPDTSSGRVASRPSWWRSSASDASVCPWQFASTDCAAGWGCGQVQAETDAAPKEKSAITVVKTCNIRRFTTINYLNKNKDFP
jgi:hypothetical protein